MIVRTLQLNHFKNHKSQEYHFSPVVNCFVGDNGKGKTNLLDALHFLSLCKSFLGTTDVEPISYGEGFFSLQAVVDDGEKENNILLSQSLEQKKILKKNNKNYEKLSDHIGFLPCVMISPYDNNLITDSGESRRKFLDSMISQTDKNYLFHLIQYQKTLKQRNALLKSFQKHKNFDTESLEIYSPPISTHGSELYLKRKAFIEEMKPWIQAFYVEISGGNERIDISYQSDIDQTEEPKQRIEKLLQTQLEKDQILGYTSKGLHKDDLVFLMNDVPLKKNASQGQQKSFLISLKLAQIQRIKTLTGKKPILLLDDIFDKLDEKRVTHLIGLVKNQQFGQMFITDTHKERTQEILQSLGSEVCIFEIK